MINVFKCSGGRLPCSKPCYIAVPRGTQIDTTHCILKSSQNEQIARFFQIRSAQITELTEKCASAIAYGSPVQDIDKKGLN